MSTTSNRLWREVRGISVLGVGVLLPLQGSWAEGHVQLKQVQSSEEAGAEGSGSYGGKHQGPRAALRRERASTRAESERILRRATEIYGSLLRGEHGAVPQSVLKSAQCVSIFPNVVTVALAVGGTHGDGVAFCKDAAGRWAGPVFMDVTGGSLGLQMGAKAVDTVIFYTGARAKAAIEEGRFTLSGELDAVAGKFEESFTPPAVGAVSYMRSEGAFIGASLTGMSVYTDKGTMKAFYGAKAGQERVFELAPPESVAPRVNALRELLPKAG